MVIGTLKETARGRRSKMNGLRIHSVDNIKVKREDYESFTTITVTVTDKTDQDFELTLFTDKGFVPDMEVQDGDS